MLNPGSVRLALLVMMFCQCCRRKMCHSFDQRLFRWKRLAELGQVLKINTLEDVIIL
jgi:hypothetical protein